MKRVILMLILLSSVLAVIPIKPYVNDIVDGLDDVSIGKLEQVAMHIFEETNIRVILVFSNQTQQIANYTDIVFDDSILIIRTLDAQGYVIVGDNVKERLPDEVTKQIIIGAQPLFDNEKYYEGFRYMLNEILIETDMNSEGEKVDAVWGIILFVGIIFIISLIILNLKRF